MDISVFQFKLDGIRYDDELEIWFIEIRPLASVCTYDLLNQLIWREGVQNGLRIEMSKDKKHGLIASSRSFLNYHPIVESYRVTLNHAEIFGKAMSLFEKTNVLVEFDHSNNWLRMYHQSGSDDKEHLVKKWMDVSYSDEFNSLTNTLNAKILDLRDAYPQIFDPTLPIPIY